MNFGASNRPIYDKCSYQKQLHESTSPFSYMMYFGREENCGKCVHDKFWIKNQLVDVESELRNQTRPLSHCDQYKYMPNCNRSTLCLSTFDKTVPVVPAPELCPIVHNNIPRQTHPGYTVPSTNICNK